MKKRICKTLLSIAFAGMLLGYTAFAAEMEAELFAIPQQTGLQKLVICVDNLNPGDEVMLQVKNPEGTLAPEDITETNVKEAFIQLNQKTVGEDNSLRFAVNIPLATAEKEIPILIYNVSTGETLSCSFPYRSQTTLNTVLGDIYAGKDNLQETFALVNQYKQGLGIHSALYDEFEALNSVPVRAMGAMTEKLYTVSDYEEYTRKLYDALVLDAINTIKDAETFIELLLPDTEISCAAELGLTGQTGNAKLRYEKLCSASGTIRTEVARVLMEKSDYTAASFLQEFQSVVFMTNLSGVKNSDQIDQLITESDDILSNAAAFLALSEENRALAAAEIYEKRAVTSLALFDALLAEVNEEYGGSSGTTTPGTGGGGSLGGGSGSGGGIGGVGGIGGGAVAGAYQSPAETEEASGEEAPLTVDKMTLPFSDLGGVAWAEEAISVLYHMGVLSGREPDKFYPDDFVTREEFVKMAVILFGYAQEGYECSFTDVAKGDWFYPYVAAAQHIGAVKGVSETAFGTGEYITREQLMTMAYRFASLAGAKFFDGAVYVPFDDDALISDYAREAIERMAAVGVVSGDGSALYPGSFCTRAEAAKILYNTYLLLISK